MHTRYAPTGPFARARQGSADALRVRIMRTGRARILRAGGARALFARCVRAHTQPGRARGPIAVFPMILIVFLWKTPRKTSIFIVFLWKTPRKTLIFIVFLWKTLQSLKENRKVFNFL